MRTKIYSQLEAGTAACGGGTAVSHPSAAGATEKKKKSDINIRFRFINQEAKTWTTVNKTYHHHHSTNRQGQQQLVPELLLATQHQESEQ